MEHCHLIKIDVEGMELDVLQGAAETLARHRPPLYNPDNYFANQENAFAELISQNMFCMPRERDFEVAGLVEITSPEAGQSGG